LILQLLVGTNLGGLSSEIDLIFRFIECGGARLSYDFVDNSIVVKNFSCDTKASISNSVLTAGVHHLQFTFGDEIGFANNQASSEADLQVIKSNNAGGFANPGETIVYTIFCNK